MAQLWGGRFRASNDELVEAFNASIGFDRRMFRVDLAGSRAHVRMLAKVGILTGSERDAILAGLDGIERDVENGDLLITEDYEDIHSFVEANLIERIGEPGKKLHTGRSRNDQVALDMRLYIREEIDAIRAELTGWMKALYETMQAHTTTYLPGFTHLQKAQPVTLAHHLGAYFEMALRDRDRFASIRKRMNVCPLGSGALAGTTYPLDREWVAKELGFDRACANSMDGVSDRDYLIETLDALAIVMMHLSRFCEEIILWNSDDYRFVELSDAYSTGSSIMPQKKNPDIAELIRGKTGRIYGHLLALLTTMKGLPLAYNKDMQEDKEGVFDAIDTTRDALVLITGMLRTATFRPERMAESAKGGFINATDAADYLVEKGIPFRDAHTIIGHLVLTAIEKGTSLDDLPLSEWKKECDAFEEDIFEAISLERCVSRRTVKGAPGAIAEELAWAGSVLEKGETE